MALGRLKPLRSTLSGDCPSIEYPTVVNSKYISDKNPFLEIARILNRNSHSIFKVL